MKHWPARILVLGAAVLLSPLLLWPGSCAIGVASATAFYQSDVHPDIPFDGFAAGHLGIIQPTWKVQYLYAAYRYVVGRGFSADEEKALLSMWNEELGLGLSGDASRWVQTSLGVDNATVLRAGEAAIEWLAARRKVPGAGAIDGIGIYRGDLTGLGFAYANCNGSSFRTAAGTLDTMIGKFGLSSQEVAKWLAAQDQVFDNCSDRASDFGVNTDAWSEMADEWSKPRRTVTAMPTLPQVQSYCKGMRLRMAGRELEAMIRRLGAANPQLNQWVAEQDKALEHCSQAPESFEFGAPTPAPIIDLPEQLTDRTPFEQAQRRYQIACTYFYSGRFDDAAQAFEAIARDPSSPWRQLAPYLVARATIRKATLSEEKNDHRLMAQAEAQLNEIVATSSDNDVRRYAQQLLGFVAAQLHPVERIQELAHAVTLPTPGDELRQDVSDYVWMLSNSPVRDNPPSDDLTDWISTFSTSGAGKGDNAALLSHSIEKWESSSSLPWLVAALANISPTDSNVPALLKAAEKVNSASPAFVTLSYDVARLLIAQDKIDEGRNKLSAMLDHRDELPPSTTNQILALRMAIARNLNEMLVDAPRIPVGVTAAPLLDWDGAGAFTRWLPLSVLLQATRSETLPSSVRGRLALATFVRAILLGNEDSARELAPQVSQSFSQLAPAIDAWLGAKDADSQRFAAAFMMLQNPGMRFYITPGPGRFTPLDELNSSRDNWWPAGVVLIRPGQNFPSFLSAAQKKDADDEWHKLSAINAPNFLCSGAIDWAKAHPNDERVPEALYRCLRAVHLGCSNSQSTTLARSAFIMLHHHYPQSGWASKGRYWYKGDNCPDSIPST